jgi:hypothetical protein
MGPLSQPFTGEQPRPEAPRRPCIGSKTNLTRETLPSSIRQVRKNIAAVPREAPGLPQSQITGDEEHHHNNAHNVENTAHVSFSFLS